ncbi:ferritin-like domain-containing protein [Paenibacillus spiritus]|uniref:Ferritin-like domain-containing protein n=1 Tax=Paenibacillus spiritus TaxID=2496557 RepID=A0A5J5GJL5_9BACL|nr:ferritin-like domain-containing protein [Paenibacillus spiritus]KAA9007704.1 ferritin-like domain-containing protein [Paenibacillus spiritus]
MYAHYYHRQGWQRAAFQPVWATSYAQALELMKQSVQGEKSDEWFYDQLIRLAPNKEQADIIVSIRNDERSHNRMFRQILQELTGQQVGPGNPEEAESPPATFRQGLQTALFGELSAVERYRKMWFGLPPGVYKDTVFGIMIDELKHADKYNYLLGTLHEHKAT